MYGGVERSQGQQRAVLQKKSLSFFPHFNWGLLAFYEELKLSIRFCIDFFKKAFIKINTFT